MNADLGNVIDKLFEHLDKIVRNIMPGIICIILIRYIVVDESGLIFNNENVFYLMSISIVLGVLTFSISSLFYVDIFTRISIYLYKNEKARIPFALINVFLWLLIFILSTNKNSTIINSEEFYIVILFGFIILLLLIRIVSNDIEDEIWKLDKGRFCRRNENIDYNNDSKVQGNMDKGATLFHLIYSTTLILLLLPIILKILDFNIKSFSKNGFPIYISILFILHFMIFVREYEQVRREYSLNIKEDKET